MPHPFQRLLTALLFALAYLMPGLAAAQTFPELTGRVVDAANILPPDVETSLTEQLAGLEQQSKRQVVVVTLPDLQGYEIADYGYRLGRHWGIGDKGRNDGALLIVAPKDRKVRIEVGYGLEPVLTDGMSFLIVNNEILPRFKAGDMPGGIVAGTQAIVRQLALPEEEARKLAAQANADAKSNSSPSWPFLLFNLFFLLFFIFPVIRAFRGGGRRYGRSGLGPVVVWGGGGRSGGGFSGGGFSGGGGSFGGGGASGSW